MTCVGMGRGDSGHGGLRFLVPVRLKAAQRLKVS